LEAVILEDGCPTVCVSGVWASVDSAWKQEKLEAGKMLIKRAASHMSGARFVKTLGGSSTCS